LRIAGTRFKHTAGTQRAQRKPKESSKQLELSVKEETAVFLPF
jgi:hypothetical protein